METMRDCHGLYLKIKCFVIANVFENVRDICMKNYRFDPAWYHTATGLA